MKAQSSVAFLKQGFYLLIHDAFGVLDISSQLTSPHPPWIYACPARKERGTEWEHPPVLQRKQRSLDCS